MGAFQQEYVREGVNLMRWFVVVFLLLAIAAGQALAHGPQIQATLDGGKVVTRRLLGDGPYSTSLTAPTSVYVMGLNQYLGVWLSHPNDELLPGDIPEFPSGPGFAYGYGFDAGTNPAPFSVGSQLVLGFTAGLKAWNGAAFVDAGATELEAFRGSGVNLVVARTSDAGPHANIKFPSVISPATGITFAGDGNEVHTSVSYRMLGDGSSTASALADGIYLASLQLGSTDASLATSEPFYFVLTKNAASAEVQAATAALGVDPGRVQFVPEPTTLALDACGFAVAARFARRQAR
jgi:hypothetical protein